MIVDAPAQPNTPSYALRQQSPAHAAPHERPKPWATVRTSGHEEQRGSTADSTCGVHQAASRTRVKFRPQRTENSRQWLARRDTVAMKITSRGHRTRPAHNSCPQDPVAVLACTHAKTPCHCVRIREAGWGRSGPAGALCPSADRFCDAFGAVALCEPESWVAHGSLRRSALV